MGQFSNYYEYINGQAVDFVDEYIDTLLDDIKEGNTDAYEYFNDSRIHEWVDNDFIYVGLMESAEILDQSDNVEDDSGLWEGQQPEDAIQTKAFFTYRNDLYNAVRDLAEGKLSEKMASLEEYADGLSTDIGIFESRQDSVLEQNDELEKLQDEHESIMSFIENISEAIETL